jgi:hypothetical protein
MRRMNNMPGVELNTKIRVLLELYKAEGLEPEDGFTIQELSEITGININYDPLKRWLVEEGVLKSEGMKIVRREIKGGIREFTIEAFTINYKLMDLILCAEFPTKILYDRHLSGKTQVFPKLKSRKRED